MFVFTILIGILVIGVYLINQSQKKDPKRISGVYSQPGKWYGLKYMTMSLILALRRLKIYLNREAFDEEIRQKDALQNLSSHKLAFDAVFWHAVTQDGIYICTGTDRKHNGIVQGLVYIVLPKYGILENEKLPSTNLKADPDSLYKQECFAAEGICFQPIEKMRRWKVSYKGKLRQKSNPQNIVEVELDAEWHSDYPWFLFEIDVPRSVYARSIALETWTRNYFRSLKEAHQSHYEQMGFLNGTLKVNGELIPLNDIDSFRDHSFGTKRDWSLMYRYIFHIFHLSDKKRVSFGVASQPCTASTIFFGYVCHPDGRLDPIYNTDLVLYQHGEDGNLPDGICFTLSTKEDTYEVKVKYELDAAPHFKGSHDESRLHERFFSCEVNGVTGRGISEWQYNTCFDKRALL